MESPGTLTIYISFRVYPLSDSGEISYIAWEIAARFSPNGESCSINEKWRSSAVRGRAETRTFKGNWGKSLWFIGGSSSEVRDGKLLKRAYCHTIQPSKQKENCMVRWRLSCCLRWEREIESNTILTDLSISFGSFILLLLIRENCIEDYRIHSYLHVRWKKHRIMSRHQEVTVQREKDFVAGLQWSGRFRHRKSAGWATEGGGWDRMATVKAWRKEDAKEETAQREIPRHAVYWGFPKELELATPKWPPVIPATTFARPI